MAAKKLIRRVRDNRRKDADYDDAGGIYQSDFETDFHGSALFSAIQWWRFGFPRIERPSAVCCMWSRAGSPSVGAIFIHNSRQRRKALAEIGDALGQGSTMLGLKRRPGNTCGPAAH
jgi:hypothetical protein